MDTCPRKVFSFNGMSQDVEIEDANKCNLCEECFKYTNDKKIDNAIRIDENDKKYIFTVEATGSLPPHLIVLKAIREIKKKLRTLQEQI